MIELELKISEVCPSTMDWLEEKGLLVEGDEKDTLDVACTDEYEYIVVDGQELDEEDYPEAFEGMRDSIELEKYARQQDINEQQHGLDFDLR